jgi:hypothetical protein
VGPTAGLDTVMKRKIMFQFCLIFNIVFKSNELDVPRLQIFFKPMPIVQTKYTCHISRSCKAVYLSEIGRCVDKNLTTWRSMERVYACVQGDCS